MPSETSDGASRAAPQPASLTVSEKMRQLFMYAAHVAGGDAKVLITGESGVGKDVVARHIHAHSARRNREYVAVNCALATESRLESELFGPVNGGNTGRSDQGEIGKLQRAHRGTLFLDELGGMTPRMQELLLRFLENGEILSVGPRRSRSVVNVRVVAATNRNLPELVAAGKFREDLLHRLRVVHLHVPPLRERSDDVRALGSHYLEQSGRGIRLTDSAWTALADYRWPGNIRELQHVIEQLTRSRSGIDSLDACDLPSGIRDDGQAASLAPERRRQTADVLYDSLAGGGHTFWNHVYPMFINRDITRHDLRELVRRGLMVSVGSYRGLLDLFSVPQSDHERFMLMLSAHDCRPDLRDIRTRSSADERLDPLHPIVEFGSPGKDP